MKNNLDNNPWEVDSSPPKEKKEEREGHCPRCDSKLRYYSYDFTPEYKPANDVFKYFVRCDNCKWRGLEDFIFMYCGAEDENY